MKKKKAKGVKLFFFGTIFWIVFMFINILLGYAKKFLGADFSYFITLLVFLFSGFMGYYFAARFKDAVLRDICFIGFFWVWLTVMFEYWFLTYINNYTPDFVLRNNMLFSSPVQVVLYFILFFSPIYFFKRNQGN